MLVKALLDVPNIHRVALTGLSAVKGCKREADTAAQNWETIGERRTKQSELGDKCKFKDCRAEADTAAQSWETNVKDCNGAVINSIDLDQLTG